MRVDPNTGLPMDEPQGPESLFDAATGAANMKGGLASGMAQEAGLTTKGSIVDKALKVMPGASQTVAWNMFRGSRTIAYGARGVDQATSLTATFSPRYMGRMPSMKALGGRSVNNKPRALLRKRYEAGESYTPFNALAKGGNSIVRNIGKGIDKYVSMVGASTKNGAAIGEQAVRDVMNKSRRGRAALRISGYAREGERTGEGVFNAGALSRITAADKIARGAMPTSNVMNFLEETDSRLFSNVTRIRNTMGLSGESLTSKEASHLVAMTNSGSISGRVGGFMSTMRTGALEAGTGTSEAGINLAGRMSGTTAYRAGSEAAVKFMEHVGVENVGGKIVAKEGTALAEKLGTKVYGAQAEKLGVKAIGKLAAKGEIKLAAKLGAALAPNAVPIAGQVVSAIMLADLAMDVGKLGVEVFKSGVDFAKEAAISYKGTINKGVMGMGYRDNTVAATSRARGVQAIQNSRLNARSVLGSEAGAMHAHFG